MSEARAQTRKWVEVADATEIPEGEARTFEVEGVRVAVCRANGQLYAVQDVCTHDDGPLGEGSLQDYAIECPRHGARFDVRTGAVLQMPAVVPIETYPVMEKDGRVQVGLVQGEDEGDADDDW